MIVPGELEHQNNLRKWQDCELVKLQSLIKEDTPFAVMAALLGRSQEAIRTKAHKAGLLRTR